MLKLACKIIAIFIFLSVVPSCFFKKGNIEGIIGYRHGWVFLTKEKRYKVGNLSDGWKVLKTRAKAITFYNSKFKASITTTAYCEDAVKNRPPELLVGELLSDLRDRITLEERQIQLKGRDGFLAKTKGKMGNNEVLLYALAIRDGGCAFDFMLVAPTDVEPEAVSDFEGFFGGFEY